MQIRVLAALLLPLNACTHRGDDADSQVARLTREQLMDPQSCQGCHPQHYREWSSSMHAYAAEDPVFLAMNRRGQRETEGELGEFCVRCHAPMALREGATSDGLNLSEVPKKLQGVTCYFCHNATNVDDVFNNHIDLADDVTLRGAIADPVDNGAHASTYSPLQDRNRSESSRLCGACHDVVTPSGVHLERTYREYEKSLFAGPGPGFDTCSGCHMPGRPGAVAATGPANDRTRHEHLWPGVDTALSGFPDRQAQRLAIECELSLGTRIYDVSQDGLGGLTVRLETSAGHRQPSGAAPDRRLWLEVVAYDADDRMVFSSGVVGDREPVAKAVGSPGFDPQLALYRDWIYDERGQEVHMFWQAAPSSTYPDGYASWTLPPPLTPLAPHTLEASYQIPGFARVVRVRMRLRMRAVGIDVLQSLVNSGDLDPRVVDELPTFTLHGVAVDYDTNTQTMQPLWPPELHCPESYRCLIDPDAC